MQRDDPMIGRSARLVIHREDGAHSSVPVDQDFADLVAEAIDRGQRYRMALYWVGVDEAASSAAMLISLCGDAKYWMERMGGRMGGDADE